MFVLVAELLFPVCPFDLSVSSCVANGAIDCKACIRKTEFKSFEPGFRKQTIVGSETGKQITRLNGPYHIMSMIWLKTNQRGPTRSAKCHVGPRYGICCPRLGFRNTNIVVNNFAPHSEPWHAEIASCLCRIGVEDVSNREGLIHLQ